MSSPNRPPDLAGSLACLSVPELLGLASSTLKTCRIEVHAGGVKRTVWLRDGQVVYAASTDPLERLGPALLRQGMIDAATFAKVQARVGKGRQLGRVLVDDGHLRAPDVYLGIGHQIRHIVLALFDVPTGGGSGRFELHEDGGEPPSEVKLPQRTRDLLLEGLKRAELAARAGAVIADGAAVPAKVVPSPADPLPGERVVLAAIDGKRHVTGVIAAAGVGELHGRIALAGLVERGLVRVDARPREQAPHPRPTEADLSEPQPSGGPFEVYRRALRKVFEALRKAGAHHNLDLFLLDPASGDLFEDATFGEDGELDVDAVLAAARATSPEPLARARALEALEKLLSYGLFEVKNVLPGETARGVLSEVQRIQLGR